MLEAKLCLLNRRSSENKREQKSAAVELRMIKPERESGETRPMLCVPAGMVLPPATNSNGTFTTMLLASWAGALMPNPSKQVRVSTTVKYDFFIDFSLLKRFEFNY